MKLQLFSKRRRLLYLKYLKKKKNTCNFKYLKMLKKKKNAKYKILKKNFETKT